MMRTPSPFERPRTGTARALATAATAWLCLVALLSLASAQAPALVPTYAFVQEAEPIVFRLTPGTDARWLDTIGLVDQGPLSIAFRDGQERGFRLAFRLASDEPTTIRRFVLGDATGDFVTTELGIVTVVPALATGEAPLRRRAAARFGAGPLLHAWRLVNETGAPQVVRSLAFAPAGVARPVVVARVRAAGEGTEELLAWLDRLRDDLAELVPEGREAAPARVEAALRERLPVADVRDPHALGLILAPGETLDLVLTSASFALDLSEVRVVADPILHGVGPDGNAWAGSLSQPVRAGPWP